MPPVPGIETAAVDSFAPLLDAARLAVLRASEVCRLVQSSLDRVRAITKDDDSPVTVADFAAQAVVAMTLRERLGNFRLIAEESSAFLRDSAHASHLEAALLAARRSWPDATADAMLDAIDLGNSPESSGTAVSASAPTHVGFWTLDPIDGTKGFLRGHQYAVCLAYIVGSDPVVAALGCPNLPADGGASLQANDPVGCLYLATQSRADGAVTRTGCRLDSMEMHGFGPAEPVRRTPRPAAALPVLVESFEPSHSRREATSSIMQRLIDRLAGTLGLPTGLHECPIVRIDSQCKYAVVARGQAHVYLRLPSKRGYVEKIWDHASGALIASQAGCIVSDARGVPLDFSCGKELIRNRGIVVAPPDLHAGVIDAIAELGMSEVAPSR